MMVAVHGRTLEARMATLCADMRCVGLRTKPPAPSPPYMPTLTLSPEELSQQKLQEIEESKERLDTALRGALATDGELLALIERRKVLQSQQMQLERQLEAQRRQAQQSAEERQPPDECNKCRRQGERQRQLRQLQQRMEAERRSLEEERRSVDACRRALHWEQEHPGQRYPQQPAAQSSAPIDVGFSWWSLLCCCC